jgi:ribonuclease BN (tRNA processing enzyme)
LSLRIQMIPSPGGMNGANQYLMTYLIDDHIAVDAGSLGFHGAPSQQAAVHDILISHSHIDHLASLPAFLENTAPYTKQPVNIYGNESVVDCLRRDVFNDRSVSDVEARQSSRPYRLHTLQNLTPVEIGDVRITPVAVDHVVPTLGFILEKDNRTVVIASDTGPTDKIWEAASQKPNLRGVFLEATFPNSMRWLADISKHLTPEMFAEEIRKLPDLPVVVAVHIKARFYDDVLRELRALAMSNLVIGEPGKEYSF